MNDLHNRVLADTVLPRKLSRWLGWMLRPYLTNKTGSELRLVTLLATPRLTPLRSAFCNLVMHIISVCSKEQVGWINARWIVAAVKNAFPFWNWPETENPRESVSEHSLRSPCSKTERAIPEMPGASGPKPTTGCFVNHAPEPIRNSVRASNIGKMLDGVWSCFRSSNCASFNHGMIVDTNTMLVNTI